jgi:tetratricopeptide (TPR) repeat protein
MAQRPSSWTGIAQTIKHISSFFPSREPVAEEAQLYYRRACLAATEERYDVALIFCGKALQLDLQHLPTRLLVAQIYDRGMQNVDKAVSGYRKVIALAGYESDNPYCAAARVALDALVHQIQDSRLKVEDLAAEATGS